MDTRGCFEKGSDMRDNAYIISLCMLISSMQVYNIKKVILEEDLQNLMVKIAGSLVSREWLIFIFLCEFFRPAIY